MFLWRCFDISDKPDFLFYHDCFEGIFNLFNAGVGEVLVLIFTLHMPVSVVSRHCTSPGFYIYAEDPLALVKKKTLIQEKTLYIVKQNIFYNIWSFFEKQR